MHVLIKDMPPGVWKQAKSKAALEGITVKQAVINLITAWVKGPKHS